MMNDADIQQHLTTIQTALTATDSETRAAGAFAARCLAEHLSPAESAPPPPAPPDSALDRIQWVLEQLVARKQERIARELPSDVPVAVVRRSAR